ncbi:MAG: hypothetical protein ACE5GQ_05215 [Nitrospinales bacterium]
MTKLRSMDSLKSSRERLRFSKSSAVIGIPNLIEIQKKSFEAFLQLELPPARRKLRGLEEVFQDIFPISDLNVNARIDYVGYEVGFWECGCGEYRELGGLGVVCEKCNQEVVYKEKHKLAECRQKGLSYADPIKIMARLTLFDRERIELNSWTLKEQKGGMIMEEVKHPQTGKKLIAARTVITPEVMKTLQENKIPEIVVNAVREVKEQKIFLGEMPVMSPTGTFMINGVERVIVARCTVRRGPFFRTTKAGLTLAASCFTRQELYPTGGPGSTSSSISKISST